MVDSIKQEIAEYRSLNKMDAQHLICADDVFSVLTYVLWTTKKNMHGACKYIELVLCCEYEKPDH